VIPRGIPVNLIQDASHILNSTKFNKEIIKLLFVGRIVPEKGPDIAIKAVAHLVYEMNYRKIQLDIIGTGPDKYLRELRDMVFSKGLKENIRFLGKLPHDQLLKCYETYDAFLFTSRWAEPLGITILEAMARGLLVVATNVGAASEIISDGINGLIVPKEEPIMIALAIKKISHDRGLAQKLRYAALNTVREDYGFERIVDESEKYLQKVIQEARSASKDKFAGRIL
jgi:glycosyltransferase involved in cell wall biosynthesis